MNHSRRVNIFPPIGLQSISLNKLKKCEIYHGHKANISILHTNNKTIIVFPKSNHETITAMSNPK